MILLAHWKRIAVLERVGQSGAPSAQIHAVWGQLLQEIGAGRLKLGLRSLLKGHGALYIDLLDGALLRQRRGQHVPRATRLLDGLLLLPMNSGTICI